MLITSSDLNLHPFVSVFVCHFYSSHLRHSTSQCGPTPTVKNELFMCLFTDQYLHYLQYWILTCSLLYQQIGANSHFDCMHGIARLYTLVRVPRTTDSMFFQHYFHCLFFRLSYLHTSARHLWSTFHILQDYLQHTVLSIIKLFRTIILYIRKRRLSIANMQAQIHQLSFFYVLHHVSLKQNV